MSVKLQGKVVSDQKIANKFGVSTANIQVFESKLEEDGVYIVDCSILGESEVLRGIMHYGQRKTVDNKFSIEVHLLDFSRDIYGEILEVEVLGKLREIEKFPDLPKLFAQIKKDIIQAKKFFLRRKIKSIWKNLDGKSREILAEKAFAKVSQLDSFLNAANVFIYAPKGDEIDFVQKLCEKFPDKNYFFPKIIDGEMSFFRGIFDELKVGKWGIREPEITAPAPQPTKDDFIFVPAVGANFTGNRLGNGGGFYDKFLKNNLAKNICVLPEFAVFDDIPVENWDEMVEVLIIPYF